MSFAEETFYQVAVIALAGRFPGARNVEELWRNLRAGAESVVTFSDEELLAAGVDPALLARSDYVKAGTVLDGADCFDAAFFGFAPREAELMDPQLRVFLECSWEALETAGYDPARFPGRIGVFAGMSAGSYLLLNREADWELIRSAGVFQTLIGNDKDFLPAHVSYKLGLRGPCVNVQSACSTSLVAVHLACQSLLGRESDMALAGGVSIAWPQATGYLASDAAVASPDGRCRAFDARAQGTMRGNGAGIVVLKRLADALADGDMIRAVIRGSAVNNDGARRAGFTAPGVEGQAEVIREALAVARVKPETVGLIEAHGTATPLGDPIEVAALTRAFGRGRPGSCALGSIKTNIGHLDAAAGVAGLIKAALAVERGEIPPSLSFERPNPQIDFASGPFRVSTRLEPWPAGPRPRRAGVSSFGLGGTNAHAVLEEPPAPVPGSPSRPWQLLVLSARTAPALDAATRNLAEHLRGNLELSRPDLDLADVAWTCQVGRRAFAHRRIAVCDSIGAAIEALESLHPQQVWSRVHEGGGAPSVVFLFPGGGAQYPGMGEELYRRERIYREAVDACADILAATTGLDLRALLYPTEVDAGTHAELRRTSKALPALFATEYALARLWMSWGVRPEALIGHSLGEYTAACLAGVFSLEEALSVVSTRGRLFETLPAGSMLGIPRAPEELEGRLGPELSIAAVNGPRHCVVSGPVEAVDALRRSLEEAGEESQPLHIEVAAHSSMLDPILDEFRRHLVSLRLHEPRIPFVSNVTGTWITPREATDPDYWCRHLRRTVRFSDGVRTLLAESDRLFLEAGPGQTLGTLVRQHLDASAPQTVLPSLRTLHEEVPDLAFVLRTLGRLWLAGVEVDWEGFAAGERRRRVALPTYPFERRRFRAASAPAARTSRAPGDGRRTDPADWFWLPAWKPALLSAAPRGESARRIVHHAGGNALEDFYGVLSLARDLGDSPAELTVVSSGALSVTGEEELIPERAMLAAACRVISQEMPHVTCRLVDIVGPEDERLERELKYGREPIVALRGDRRLVESFVPVRVEAPQGTPGLRREGVYLITGGLGRVGMVLAEWLARTVAARLVLVGRSPGDPAKVRRLEEAGGEVLVARADVGDEEQMRAAVAAGVERFGALHGVIHAAADTRSEAFAPVAELTREVCELQLRPKVHGLYGLERALRGIDLDFCLLTSSLASCLGGLGFAAYAGASRFMDAFARRQSRSGRVPWMSVGWEGWTAEGTGASRAARFALSDEEGAEVFRRLLSVLGEPQIAVSTGDLEERIAATGERQGERVEERKDSEEGSGRSAAQDLPAAPRDEVEHAVAGIWRELLGVERLGIWDDFFELGGHSLLATRVVARVRETWRIDLPLLDLFREPTVAGLSQRVRERLGTAAVPGSAPIAAARGREEELLAGLPEMSDADIDVLIRDILAGQGEIR